MSNFDVMMKPVEHICPNCGYVLGEVATFQLYEYKVAAWLMGQVAPALTKGFDVYRCHDFGALTFQVKIANAHHPRRKEYVNRNAVWMWNQHGQSDLADYFVLCGILDEAENWFLLSREDFFARSAEIKRGGWMLQGSCNKTSRIWSYHVADPVTSLRDTVLRYDELSQERASSALVAASKIKPKPNKRQWDHGTPAVKYIAAPAPTNAITLAGGRYYVKRDEKPQ
jgi:hypothetical protein